MEPEDKWYNEGIKFKCQGSGKCCASRGEYGFVYLNIHDRRRMAKHLDLKTQVFTKTRCKKTDGFYHLKESQTSEDCMFLKENKCSIYEGRPTQCRTWPFWPEVMNPKVWRKEVIEFCPGINKGRIYSALEIDKIIKTQTKSEQIV